MKYIKFMFAEMKIYIIIFSLIFISFVSWSIYCKCQYSNNIEKWGRKNGYSISSIEWKWFSHGPYSFLSCGKGTAVYKVNTNAGEYWIKFWWCSPNIQDVKKSNDEK